MVGVGLEGGEGVTEGVVAGLGLGLGLPSKLLSSFFFLGYYNNVVACWSIKLLMMSIRNASHVC
jgi:hypothetical protein